MLIVFLEFITFMPLIFKDILRTGPPDNATNLRLVVPSKCLSEMFGLRDGTVLKGVLCEVLDWNEKI